MAALKYWLWLTQLSGLGNQTRLSLLEHFGDPERIYFADEGELLLAGMGRRETELLARKDWLGADRVLGRCQELGVRILTMQDAEYPMRLHNIYDPPCLLYVRGRLPLLDEEAAVAVVGTRDATPYGIRAAEELGRDLGRNGAVLVTGLARGIDSAAARGALRGGGAVVGVLGGGVDVIYPAENGTLYADVTAAGALVSEYPPGTETRPGNFPARNRILSGISLAALVVEAPERSGALITASLALEQSRDVFAVPGPIDSKQSAGCNRLIREGAGLVACAADLLEEYAGRYPGKLRLRAPSSAPLTAVAEELTPAEPARPVLSLSHPPCTLTDDQIKVLRTLETGELQVDDLIERTEIPARRMLSALTVLELENMVRQESGKRYSLAVTLVK